MSTLVRFLKAVAIATVSFYFSACSPDDSRNAAQDSQSPRPDNTEQQQTEFGGRPESEPQNTAQMQAADPEVNAVGAVGYPETESGSQAVDSEPTTAQPETPVQGQRPYELLLTAGVDEARIAELAQNGFPREDVRSAAREGLVQSGRAEKEADREAEEIAQWVENWVLNHDPIYGSGESNSNDAATKSDGATKPSNNGWEKPSERAGS